MRLADIKSANSHLIGNPEESSHLFLKFHLKSKDWPNIADGFGVSAKQRAALELLRVALRKHIESGNDKRFSEMCPIRAWMSFLKNAKQAAELIKKWNQEIETMGPNPYSFILIDSLFKYSALRSECGIYGKL